MMARCDPATLKFRHRDVDAIAGAALLLIALGAFWAGFWPIFQREDDERQLASELVESRRQLATVQTEYGQVRKAIALTTEQLRASSVVLNTADGLVQRQEDITRTVSGGEVALEQLVVGAAQRGDLLDTVPIHLSGSATYPEVVGIMHELRTSFPDMAITAFQLGSGGVRRSGPGGRSEKTIVRFEMDIAWYTAHSEPRGK